MSVTQKVLAGLAAIVAVLAVLIVATAYLTSPAVAIMLWAGGLVAFVAYAALVPVRTSKLISTPGPRMGFDECLARFASGSAAEADRLNPLCHARLLHHGAPTPTVVVLIHGISSCPQAFVDFAPQLYARGHTVLAARMPCNGLKDRATDALNRLTAEKLAGFGDEITDLAQGLGGEVIVCGISAGGTVAAWVGQYRQDVERAVLVAPFLGLPGIGPRMNFLVMRLMLALPALSIWKDPVLRERFEGMPHAYKRQSTRGTGEVLRLGYTAMRHAKQAAPSAMETVLVLNENDGAINNDIARHYGEMCGAAGGTVENYLFDRRYGLGHEIIDPLEPGADPKVTYPVLIELIEGARPTEDPST